MDRDSPAFAGERRPRASRVLWSWLVRLWDRLTLPIIPLLPSHQRSARLLGGLLLSLLLFIGLTLVVMASRSGRASSITPSAGRVILLAGPLLLIAFALNRVGRLTLAAGLTLTIVGTAAWAMVWLARDSLVDHLEIVFYPTLSILFAGLLLPGRATLLTGLANLAVLLVLQTRISTGFPPHTLPLWYFLITLLATLGSALRRRDQAELEQQAATLAADVAERKQAEVALQESQQQLANAFDNAAIGMAWVSLDGRWLRANRALCALLGYTESELQATDIQTLTDPADLAVSLALRQGVLAGQQPSYQIEKRYRHKSGQAVWALVTATLLRDPAGQPLYFFAQVQDISERKASVEALRQSSERYRAMLEEANRLRQFNDTIAEVMGEGLVLEDPAGLITLVNPKLLEMLGYAEAELVGRHYSAIVAPRELPAVTAQARRRQAGATTRYETRLLTRGGQEVPVIIAGTPLYKDGRFTGTLATIVDISERKAGEETIQHANQELTRWLMEAEQRTRETTLLNELGDLLQGCRTAADAYVVVGEILGPLFPGDSGRFYIQAQVRLETAAQWGPPLAAPFDFSADDCQAMRHGRLHAGLLPGSGLSPACTHLAQPKPLAYVCAPLIAQAETLGLLHLSTASPNAGWLEARQRLARTVADSLALALANLELRERLRQQSIRDPLTGLFNRRYLEETFERELHRAEREARPVGIIMLDLDHFKQFNDDLGHEAGDHLLRELGCLLRTQVRGADIPCRYGGEEFTIILPGASLEVARDRAQVICQAVNQMQVTFAGQPLQRVTLSAGVAVFPDHGATADQVLRAADAALYRAKHLGRHRVHAAE